MGTGTPTNGPWRLLLFQEVPYRQIFTLNYLAWGILLCWPLLPFQPSLNLEDNVQCALFSLAHSTSSSRSTKCISCIIYHLSISFLFFSKRYVCPFEEDPIYVYYLVAIRRIHKIQADPKLILFLSHKSSSVAWYIPPNRLLPCFSFNLFKAFPHLLEGRTISITCTRRHLFCKADASRYTMEYSSPFIVFSQLFWFIHSHFLWRCCLFFSLFHWKGNTAL
jgi:hypothetical protein